MDPEGPRLYEIARFLTAAMIVLGPLVLLTSIVPASLGPASPDTALGGVWSVLEVALDAPIEFVDQVGFSDYGDAFEALLGLVPLATGVLAFLAFRELSDAQEAGWRMALAAHGIVLVLGPWPPGASLGSLAVLALAGVAVWCLLRRPVRAYVGAPW